MADCIKVKQKSAKYTQPLQTGASGVGLDFINQKT